MRAAKNIVAAYKSEFRVDKIAKLLCQFESGITVNEDAHIKDQIISLVILIMIQNFIFEKTKFFTQPFVE